MNQSSLPPRDHAASPVAAPASAGYRRAHQELPWAPRQFMALVAFVLLLFVPFAMAQQPIASADVPSAGPATVAASTRNAPVGRATLPPASALVPAKVLENTLIAPMAAGTQQIRAANARMSKALADFRTQPPSETTRRELLSTTLAAIDETRMCLEAQLQHEGPLLKEFKAQQARLDAEAKTDQTEQETVAEKQRDATARLSAAERQRNEVLANRDAAEVRQQERLMAIYADYRAARRDARSAVAELEALQAEQASRRQDQQEILAAESSVHIHFHDLKDDAATLAILSRRLERSARRLEVHEVLSALATMRSQLHPGRGQVVDQVRDALCELGAGETMRPPTAAEVDPDFQTWIAAGNVKEGGR